MKYRKGRDKTLDTLYEQPGGMNRSITFKEQIQFT